MNKTDLIVYAWNLQKIAIIKCFSILDKKLLKLVEDHIDKGINYKHGRVQISLEGFDALLKRFNEIKNKRVNKEYPYLAELNNDRGINSRHFLFYQYLYTVYAIRKFNNKSIDYTILETLFDFRFFINLSHLGPISLTSKDDVYRLVIEKQVILPFYLFIKYLFDLGFNFERHSKLETIFNKAKQLIVRDLNSKELELIKEERKKLRNLRF